MKLDIALEGLPELLEAFRGVERGMLDFRDLGTWDEVQRRFYQIEKEQFGSEGAAGKSGKWAALTSPYREIKQKRYGEQPILQATGRGYKSLTSANSDSVVEKRPQELVLGSRLPYMKFHQTGTRRMKKREPISLTPEQERRMVVEPIQKHLRQIVANAKLRLVR